MTLHDIWHASISYLGLGPVVSGEVFLHADHRSDAKVGLADDLVISVPALLPGMIPVLQHKADLATPLRPQVIVVLKGNGDKLSWLFRDLGPKSNDLLHSTGLGLGEHSLGRESKARLLENG